MNQKKVKQISEENIDSVDLGMAYLVFDRRNLWTDWNGTTAMSRRNWGFVLSLNDAEQWAEASRLQGTGFIIDELPMLCVRSRSGALLLSERNSSRPMSWYPSIAPSLDGVRTIGALASAFAASKVKWGIQHLSAGRVNVTATSGVYYSRESSPGKGRNHLAWSLMPQKIDDTPMRQIAADMQRLVSGAGVRL